MPKIKKTTVVVKCQCTTCKQVAHVQAGTQHFYCNGIKVEKPMPTHLYNRIKHPDESRKGKWEAVSP